MQLTQMIDKQYIIGYELLKNGKLITDFNEGSSNYIKEVAIKNKIIDTILKVVLNHKNMVNLTATVSMDDLKRLKNKASKKDIPLDHANPADVFSMIEENASGKDTIGITAVAGKAFSVMCYYYNGLVNQVKNHILAGHFGDAITILEKIPDFPNLDWSWIKKTPMPENLREMLNAKRNASLLREDAYLLIGQFLNASADNAKELILKKIRANGEWADIYVAGIILGYSLDEIFDIMTNPNVEEFINKKQGSSLYKGKYVNDKQIVQGIGGDFENIYVMSQKLQLIGKLAGINQGFKTKKYDISKMMSGVKKSAETILNWNIKTEEKLSFNVFDFFLKENNNYTDIYNPFEIFLSHPLYKSQWLSFLTAIQISNTLSERNAIEYGFSSEKNIKKKDYNALVSKLNREMNIGWLESIGFTYGISENEEKELTPNLSISKNGIVAFTKGGVQPFINYMENFVIPSLKRLYPENYFIKSLSPGIRFEQDSKREVFYYRIPLNMMEIDTDENTRMEYGKMFKGFNSLKNVMFGNNRIHDLFYAYEILVNNTFSQASMSRFFSESFMNEGNSMIESHSRYIDILNPKDVVNGLTETDDEDISLPSIYDYNPVKKYYYDIESSSIDKIRAIPDFAKNNRNIIIFNNSNYIDILKAEGMDDAESEFVHNIGKAFVYKGKIFINSDKSDRGDLRHELAHIAIGILKTKNAYAGLYLNDFYEKNKNKFAKIMIELSYHPVYKNMQSSDLLEEAIAHYVATSELNFNDFIRGIGDSDFSTIEDFIFKYLTDDNVLKVHNIQKAESLRNDLWNKGAIKEDCK